MEPRPVDTVDADKISGVKGNIIIDDKQDTGSSSAITFLDLTNALKVMNKAMLIHNTPEFCD